MALPSYITSVPISQGIEQRELHFRLYLHKFGPGSPEHNQIIVANPGDPQDFGALAVNDWTMYDDIGLGKKLMGYAQGMHFVVSKRKAKWFIGFNMEFTDESLKGSSFQVQGDYEGQEGKWAIVGGTGKFKFAQGVITVKDKMHMELGDIKELHVHAVCLTFGRPLNTTTKVGPWGGDGGTANNVKNPLRLENLTNCSSNVVDSLAFSYMDQAGVTHTAGPWGGDGGSSKTIHFDQSESVKEVSGTTATHEGHIVVSSLTLLTNVRSYGLYGRRNGAPFSVPVGDTSSVVGFFVRAGRFIDAIGVYVHTSVPS
ncbi:hypothetical protein ACQ4PT_050007 [Festuca glaucescens]